MRRKIKKYIICIDGKIFNAENKTLEAFIPGVFQEEGVFETMLAIGNKVFDVKEHLNRLNSSFKGAKVSARMIERVVHANDLDVARVRVLAWEYKSQKHSAVIVLPYIFPQKKILKACFVKTNRLAQSNLANKKSLDYQLFVDAYKEAQSKGFDEALLINKKGYVFESSRANIFVFQEGRLITPPLSSGCLNGITRQQLMKAARKVGVVVLEKNLTVAMVKSAQEVLLTNSLIGITPCLPL